MIRTANRAVLPSEVAATNIQSSADRFISPLDFYSLRFYRPKIERSIEINVLIDCGTGTGHGLLGALEPVIVCGTGTGQGFDGAAWRTGVMDARTTTTKAIRRDFFILISLIWRKSAHE
jgi:hypothetical protein